MDEITISEGVKELSIFENKSDAWVTSRTISDMFDKEHKNVLRGIDNILVDNDDFNERNFEPVEYKDKKGEMRKEYLLNRKSFVLVVMGFTGKKALDFKKQYIEAFDAMQSIIQTRMLSKDGYKKMSDAIKNYILPDQSLACKDWQSYAKEANMINKIVLGMSSKQFRELNDCVNVRDNIVEEKLCQLNEAQTLNAQLIKADQNFRERESIIKLLFEGSK